MNIRLDHSAVRLGAGKTISVIDGKGARIAVARGRVWITQERDVRDVMLTLGQSFTLDRDGTTIVEALSDAEIALDEAAPATQDVPVRSSRLTALAVLGHRRAAPRDRQFSQAA